MTEETRSHTLRIRVSADAEKAFDALITPSAICVWWGARTAIVLPEKGGFWNAAWGDPDDPDYITFHQITDFEHPRYIELDETRYVTKFEPPPFELKMKTRFEVEPDGENGAFITVTQHGFPANPIADEFYAACEKGWHDTFEGLKTFIESGN